MKIQELMGQKLSESIQDRKKKREEGEAKFADMDDRMRKDRVAKGEKDYYTKDAAEISRSKRMAHGEAQDAILAKAFGDKNFHEYTTGSNGGEAVGKKYNKAMNDLGFTDMEVNMSGKPVEAWGPKPQLSTKWKKIGTAKDENLGGNTSFYQLKDSEKVIVMSTSTGGIKNGYRYLFIEK